MQSHEELRNAEANALWTDIVKKLPDPQRVFNQIEFILSYISLLEDKLILVISPKALNSAIADIKVAQAILKTEIINRENNSEAASTGLPTTRNLSRFIRGASHEAARNGKRYFIKPKPEDAARLEAYCAGLFHLMTPQYTPRYRTYVHPTAVGSKIIPFDAYHNNPLTEDTLNISFPAIQVAFQRNLARNYLNVLLNLITNKLKAQSTLQRVRTIFSLKPTLSQYHKTLKNMITRLHEASHAEIHAWLETFDNIDAALIGNALAINDASSALSPLLKYPEDTPDLATFQIEEIYYALEPKEKAKFSSLKGLGRTLILRLLFQNNDPNALNIAKNGTSLDFEGSKRRALLNQLQQLAPDNLITKLALASALPAFTEQTFSAFPDIPETSFFNHWPTWQANTIKFFYELGLQVILNSRTQTNDIHLEAFVASVMPRLRGFRDLLTIHTPIDPIITTAYQAYILLRSIWRIDWPTNIQGQDERALLFDKLAEIWTALFQGLHQPLQSGEQTIRNRLDINAKQFTIDDNLLFKQLAHHPVFIFYKNMSLLKYLLIDPSVYQALADLELNDPDLKRIMVDDEIESIKDVRTVLLNSAEFRQFMAERGEEAYNTIRAEVSAKIDHYNAKLATKPHYQALVDSLNLEALDNAFEAINDDIASALEAEEAAELDYGIGDQPVG